MIRSWPFSAVQKDTAVNRALFVVAAAGPQFSANRAMKKI
jgi:hypothetical protein